MGKPRKATERKKQLNPMFKLAGSRALKAKNKAKSVSTNLKRLNELTRSKVEDLDGQLVKLQTTLLQPSKGKEEKAMIVSESKPVLPPADMDGAAEEFSRLGDKADENE